MFPLYYAYGFTIAKAQGNSHIGICTVVHLNRKRKVPRKQLYVALSRTDSLENLLIVGNFEDPWFREEETRKKSKIKPRQDEIKEGYDELLSKTIPLSWTPLYKESSDSCFIVSFFNVNSLHAHIKDVQCDYSLIASDVIFFIDTRLKPGESPVIPNHQFQSSISMKKAQRIPGGLCIYAKPGVNVTMIMEIHIEEDDYFCSILSASVPGFIVIGLYVSPKCPKKLMISSLEKAISSSTACDNVIIGGDFNTEKDIDLFLDNGFIRLPLESSTIHNSKIDQIYVKTGLTTKSGVNPCYYSDHNPTFVILNSAENHVECGSINDFMEVESGMLFKSMNENMDARISNRSVEFTMTRDCESSFDTLYSSANDKFNNDRLS